MRPETSDPALRWVCLRTWGARLRGLLGRPPPAPGELWCLSPCRGVHTWGLRYSIDIVLLDAGGRILQRYDSVPPWRMRWHPRATTIWELEAGQVARLNWQLGQRVLGAPCYTRCRGASKVPCRNG